MDDHQWMHVFNLNAV
jgi:U3 small nucleolar RNA-associated protein 4